MASHLRDTQSRDELVERAGAALVHSLLKSVERLHSKARRFKDLVSVLLKFIQVAVVFDPAVLHKGCQRLLVQAFDLHAGLAAEVDKFPHQAGGTRLVFAVQLADPAAALSDHKSAAAAWADIGHGTRAALCLVLGNLGNDHIGLIHADGIPRPQCQPHEVIQVV